MTKKYLGNPDYKNDPEVRANQLIGNIKSRAKKKGLDFNLDLDWYLEKLYRGVCEVTGIPFEPTQYSKTNRGIGDISPWCPSIDRIDPSKGYTKDNCQVVVWMYNVAKSRFTHEDLVAFCRGVLIAEAVRKRKE